MPMASSRMLYPTTRATAVAIVALRPFARAIRTVTPLRAKWDRIQPAMTTSTARMASPHVTDDGTSWDRSMRLTVAVGRAPWRCPAVGRGDGWFPVPGGGSNGLGRAFRTSGEAFILQLARRFVSLRSLNARPRRGHRGATLCRGYPDPVRRRDPEPAAPAPTPLLSPALRILLGLAAAVVVLAGLFFGRELVGPLVLGAVIVIICHPVRGPLERHGWPRWAATSAVIVVAYVVLIALALLLVFAGVQFAHLVSDYADELRATGRALVDWLNGLGLDAQISDATTAVLEPSTILSFVSSLGGTVIGVLTALFFVFAYVIFMAADGARYARAEAAFGSSARPVLARFRSFNSGVRRYYVVNASFGLIVAVIDGLALWAIGVPAPVVWAILAFVTNFIPNIGFIIGLIPPMLLALVVGGWPLMLAVIAIYCVVNVVLQVLVQPKFVSDAVSLSLTLSFFSVIFWTFVIGPLGAILSIPLTLLVRALVLEGDPGARWLRWLSGDPAAARQETLTS